GASRPPGGRCVTPASRAAWGVGGSPPGPERTLPDKPRRSNDFSEGGEPSAAGQDPSASYTSAGPHKFHLHKPIPQQPPFRGRQSGPDPGPAQRGSSASCTGSRPDPRHQR